MSVILNCKTGLPRSGARKYLKKKLYKRCQKYLKHFFNKLVHCTVPGDFFNF